MKLALDIFFLLLGISLIFGGARGIYKGSIMASLEGESDVEHTGIDAWQIGILWISLGLVIVYANGGALLGWEHSLKLKEYIYRILK